MKDIKERIGKLLTIKSLVTLCLTGVFCIMAVRGDVGEAQFLAIFTMVIGFYFGTQAKKEG